MPTYALLGATGATGSSVLRHLLASQNQSLRLNVLVRSRAKLLASFPDLESRASPSVQLFPGTSTDPETLDQCLQAADVVFMCVAQNGSPMGTTLCQDTVTAMVEALRRRRRAEGPRYRPCLVIQLRSASLNPGLAAQVPRIMHKLVCFCLAASYADLQRACTIYAAARQEQLLDYVLVDPPTLHDARGVQPTGHRIISATEQQAVPLSYADLGAALCEIAVRRHQFSGVAVGVTATGPVRKTWGVLAWYLLEGGLGHVRYRVEKEASRLVMICIVLALLLSVVQLF